MYSQFQTELNTITRFVVSFITLATQFPCQIKSSPFIATARLQF